MSNSHSCSIRYLGRALAMAAAGVLLVGGVTGCRPSSSRADESAAPIHGEPIRPLKVAAPATPLVTRPSSLSLAAAPAAANYSPVGFDLLASYNFEVDDLPFTNHAAQAVDQANAQIPATVKAFNDQKVSIKGFMLPLKVADGRVTEFLIMKDQSMCCYGSVPKITEWVSVKTSGAGMKPIMDVPVSVEGTLHVGAMRENGYLIGLYQMDGDRLINPDN